MDNIYGNIEGNNPDKEPKILILLDQMIAYKLSNKKLIKIVTELFVRGKKIKHFSSFYCIILLCCTKNY